MKRLLQLFGLLLTSVVLALTVLAISGPVARAATDLTQPVAADGARAPGQIMVRVKPGINVDGLSDPAQAPAELQFLMSRLGVSRIKSMGFGSGILLLYFSGSVDQALQIATADPAIVRADANRLVKLDAASTGFALPNDPLFQNGNQWWLDRIHAREAWQITTGSASVKVGVSDDGIDANHPDLAGKVVAAYNFAEEVPTSRPGLEGHATSVAGCITANTNNGAGLAGLNWQVSLIDGKGFGQTGEGYSFDLVRGDLYAISQGAKVVNNSWGGSQVDLALLSLADYAAERDVTLVFASGNTGSQTPSYPAALAQFYPNIIAVGATDYNDQVVGFSTFGSYVSLVAPGEGIWTAEPGGGYRVINGTSFAAPIVTGVIALMLSINPNLTPAQIRSVLEGTADDISGGVGFTIKSGFGRVNAYKAVLAVKNNDLQIGKQSVITGRVSGVDPARVRLSLDPIGLNFKPGSDGTFQLSNLGKATYRLRAAVAGQGTGPGPSEFSLSGASDSTRQVNFAFQNLKPVATDPDRYVDQARFFDELPAVVHPANALYFAETGHSLSGTFRAYWESHGGLAQFGYPLSEPFTELSPTDGQLYTVQYFERNRFEYHPDLAGTPYEVELGLLGRESLGDRTFSSATNQGGRYFAATGQSLSGPFLTYWESHGGLAQFGYPVSPVLTENGRQVQYFERNRFELHSENAGTPYEVLLGRLGVDLARQRGYL